MEGGEKDFSDILSLCNSMRIHSLRVFNKAVSQSESRKSIVEFSTHEYNSDDLLRKNSMEMRHNSLRKSKSLKGFTELAPYLDTGVDNDLRKERLQQQLMNEVAIHTQKSHTSKDINSGSDSDSGNEDDADQKIDSSSLTKTFRNDNIADSESNVLDDDQRGKNDVDDEIHNENYDNNDDNSDSNKNNDSKQVIESSSKYDNKNQRPGKQANDTDENSDVINQEKNSKDSDRLEIIHSDQKELKDDDINVSIEDDDDNDNGIDQEFEEKEKSIIQEHLRLHPKYGQNIKHDFLIDKLLLLKQAVSDLQNCQNDRSRVNIRTEYSNRFQDLIQYYRDLAEHELSIVNASFYLREQTSRSMKADLEMALNKLSEISTRKTDDSEDDEGASIVRLQHEKEKTSGLIHWLADHTVACNNQMQEQREKLRETYRENYSNYLEKRDSAREELQNAFLETTHQELAGEKSERLHLMETFRKDTESKLQAFEDHAMLVSCNMYRMAEKTVSAAKRRRNPEERMRESLKRKEELDVQEESLHRLRVQLEAIVDEEIATRASRARERVVASNFKMVQRRIPNR